MSKTTTRHGRGVIAAVCLSILTVLLWLLTPTPPEDTGAESAPIGESGATDERGECQVRGQWQPFRLRVADVDGLLGPFEIDLRKFEQTI